MGTLAKKLHIVKTGGTEETCNIYTTPEEVGGSPYLALEVDGRKGYVKLGSTTDASATHLRVEKDDVIYAAWKQAASVPSDVVQMVVGRFVRTYAANYEYRWYGFSRSDSTLREGFGSLTANPINGVTIYLICWSEVVIQGERRDVDFSINTDKPCKVTIGNNTYTVDNRTSNGYEYKTTDLSNISLSDGQRLAIKVDLLLQTLPRTDY